MTSMATMKTTTTTTTMKIAMMFRASPPYPAISPLYQPLIKTSLDDDDDNDNDDANDDEDNMVTTT